MAMYRDVWWCIGVYVYRGLWECIGVYGVV